MRKTATDWDASAWCVLDLDLEELISHVVEADDETGKYVVVVKDDFCQPVLDAQGNFQYVHRTGRIKLILSATSIGLTLSSTETGEAK